MKHQGADAPARCMRIRGRREERLRRLAGGLTISGRKPPRRHAARPPMSRTHAALQAVYAGRSIELQDLPALVQSVERRPLPPAELARTHAALFADDFAGRARRLDLLRQNRDVLALVDRRYREREIDSFLYGSRRYHAADARTMLAGIDRQLDGEERWWADFDRPRLLRLLPDGAFPGRRRRPRLAAALRISPGAAGDRARGVAAAAGAVARGGLRQRVGRAARLRRFPRRAPPS